MKLLATLAASLTAAAAAASAAGAPEVGSVMTIDRTLACTVEGNRLQRELGVSATTRTANTPATIYANHNGGFADVLAGIGPTHGLGFNVQTPPMAQWLWLNRKRCTRARTSIPFTARGLTGGRVGFHDFAGCLVTRRVLVRIRATFIRDTGLAPLTDAMLVARAEPRRAELAVADSNRRPIAYLRLAGPLRVSLFARAGCERS